MRRLLVPITILAALAAGAGTAVLASGAGSEPTITIGNNTPRDEITVYGSSAGDTITYGGYTQGVTVQADRDITSLRNDCDASGTNAFCERGKSNAYSVLESRLGDGPDHIEFYDSFDAPGFRIIGRGGRGADNLNGAEKRDIFKGGRGNDSLTTLEGNDDLSGGQGNDTCDGGPGNDRIDGCEQ